MTGRAIVLRGDAAALPLEDASADLIVTSPPYFGLRSYTDGGEHYDGQIGSEATPRAYLEALWRCTAEWVRALKPSGSLFVNLGDKYAQDEERSRNGNGNRRNSDCVKKPVLGGRTYTLGRKDNGVPRKSLIGLPWRYALGCIDDLGLILRAEVIWDKPNGLPESVTDRVRRSHEQVFHFTRLPRYYSAVDEVREPHIYGTPNSPGRIKAPYGQGFSRRAAETDYRDDRDHHAANPLGKLPGSVWTIPSAPLTVPAHLGVDHFAAYPPELVRRIILGWSPRDVCTACGEGRRPVTEGEYRKHRPSGGTTSRIERGNKIHDGGFGQWGTFGTNLRRDVTITGYACACPDTTAPGRPGIVLDPFGGTGTTALVATVHGRTGISVDRSADYCRLAQWRVTDPAERARALGVPKPPPVTDGQMDLFGMEAV